ncbi:hypothetical protein ACT4ML_16235 [Natrinema sp. LN54]
MAADAVGTSVKKPSLSSRYAMAGYTDMGRLFAIGYIKGLLE